MVVVDRSCSLFEKVVPHELPSIDVKVKRPVDATSESVDDVNFVGIHEELLVIFESIVHYDFARYI